MAKDLRDPSKLGAALLNVADHFRVDAGMSGRLWADVYEATPLSVIADSDRARVLAEVPAFPGDESPLDRYGDPRENETIVVTTVLRRRLPIERLSNGDAFTMTRRETQS